MPNMWRQSILQDGDVAGNCMHRYTLKNARDRGQKQQLTNDVNKINVGIIELTEIYDDSISCMKNLLTEITAEIFPSMGEEFNIR